MIGSVSVTPSYITYVPAKETVHATLYSCSASFQSLCSILYYLNRHTLERDLQYPYPVCVDGDDPVV